MAICYICYICYIDFDLHVQSFRTDANTIKNQTIKFEEELNYRIPELLSIHLCLSVCRCVCVCVCVGVCVFGCVCVCVCVCVCT